MEKENIPEEQFESGEETKSGLHSVTPLSKYLVMMFFIVLPFIGGWIGYTYAPEKIVVKEIPAKPSGKALPQSTNQDETGDISNSLNTIEQTGLFTGYYISLEMNPDEVNGYLEEGQTVSCDAFVITEGETDILQRFGDDNSLIPTSITRLTDTILISNHVVNDEDMAKVKQSSKSNQIRVSITEIPEADRGVDTCEATIESLQVLKA